MHWANVYYIIRITNGIAEEMTNFQISSNKLNCLARNSKKWEISKEAGAREACFQNGSLPCKTRQLGHKENLQKNCSENIRKQYFPEKIFAMELKSRKE